VRHSDPPFLHYSSILSELIDALYGTSITIVIHRRSFVNVREFRFPPRRVDVDSARLYVNDHQQTADIRVAQIESAKPFQRLDHSCFTDAAINEFHLYDELALEQAEVGDFLLIVEMDRNFFTSESREPRPNNRVEQILTVVLILEIYGPAIFSLPPFALVGLAE
jgi:hypothetical protein